MMKKQKTVLKDIRMMAVLLVAGGAMAACSGEDDAQAPTLDSRQAIVKFTLKYGNQNLNATKLIVSADGQHIDVTPDAATGELWVAVPGFTNQAVILSATVGTDTYVYGKEGVTFENGKSYPVTVTLKKVEVVDLGDAGKWASVNVGATEPHEYGQYFAWGGTTGYGSADPVTDGRSIDWTTCPFWVSGTTYSHDIKFNKYVPTGKESYWGGEGNPDDERVLKAADDAATQNWGSSWKIPTKEDFERLINTDNCKWDWTDDYNGTGISGYIVTGKKTGYTGNSVFLPAAGYRLGDASVFDQGSYGYYLSSSLFSDDPFGSWSMDFISTDARMSGNYRYCGQSVRAVYVGE